LFNSSCSIFLPFAVQDTELTALSGLSAKYAKVRLLVSKPDKADKVVKMAVLASAGLTEEAAASRSEAKAKTAPVDTTGVYVHCTAWIFIAFLLYQILICLHLKIYLDLFCSRRFDATFEGFIQRGPLLLTRQGMSGPAVLKLSAFGARQMSASNYRYEDALPLCIKWNKLISLKFVRRFDVEVSWVGDLTAHQISEHFATERRLHPNRYLVVICLW
jgi:hypothetical protein